MRLVHGLVLFLAFMVLAARHGVESECLDWNPQNGSKNVCCKRCKQGNRLITDCGPDPKALCTPCLNGTYILDSSQKNCLRCTQCVGVQHVKVRCSASSDTVCECAHGFRCGDKMCSFCMQQCVEGQQPVNRDCEPCPPGTYNDQIHQPCVNWSKCTQPEHQIIVLGTAKSDVVCGPKKEPDQNTSSPDNTPTQSPPDIRSSVSPPGNIDNKITAILITFGLICILIPTFTILHLKWRKIKTMVKPLHRKKPLTAGETQAGVPEECSFCFPQQESGASSQTSMSSLVSEEKILPLRA